ncbi:probable ATP-dependent RNA helicase CG8611 [Cephus cinctus]|uniref:ATP-dependent RNA helicase n=1 Tax=Cephus cinctus TaxID=211228 RepID=A0AAJ7FTW2_CEPCN|nr:probable ATP-dependent RNA helicase CG8611 [Cephus cinctus]
MTVQDMDISLNISSGSNAVTSKKTGQSKNEFFKPHVKRLNKNAVKRNSNTEVVNTDSKHPSDKQAFDFKKRIKQKSLAAIVARNLKGTGSVNVTPAKHDVSKGKGNLTNKTSQDFNIKLHSKLSTSNEETIRQSDSKHNKNENVTSSEAIVSFIKPTKQNSIKTILAKKRSNTINDGKKSLSEIFSKSSTSDTTESNLLNSHQEFKNNEYNLPNKKPKLDHEKRSFDSDRDIKSQYESKKNRKHPDKNINTDNSKKFTGKNDKQASRSYSGRYFSLFSNNPEMPNIGQRFVKPVNEPVFTGTKFDDLDIHPFTVSNLEQNMQITKMTTVQQKAIPQILSGQDVLVRSQTGSGKTLAYAIPIIETLHKIRPKLTRDSGLRALVVVPTRELALQTYECFLKLIKPFTWIVPGYLVGGEKRKAEKARLRKGCTILIVTPGRLLDHVKHTEALKLDQVKCFVLDEADRMLDMGYEKDISSIVDALKNSNLTGSATGYNPMEMLRQNVKKTFGDDTANTDNETDDETKKNESKIQSKNIESEKDGFSDSNEETETNNISQKEYHSGTDTDSDAEDQKFPIRINKKCQKTAEPTRQIKSEPKKDAESVTTDTQGRQTILLSATLTQAVEKLAGLTMQNPIFIDAAQENLLTSGGSLSELNEDLIVPQSVTQSYIMTPPKLRMVTLSAYIAGKCRSSGQHKLLVFMATQDMVDYHMEILSSILTKPTDEDDEDSDPLVDVEFFKLHGNMSQKERTEVFKTFRKARGGVLLCTDVAARGLDMPKVDCVVQYTGPVSARDYVHRIGRTARAGTAGSATIFLTPSEVEFVRMLESRRIRIKQEDMNDVLDKLLGPLSKHSSSGAAANALQNDFETLILENKKLHGMACKAYVSWIRFYSSYPHEMREIFNRKELHLGHYARSFGLRDPPQRIGGIGKKLWNDQDPMRKHDNRLSNERTKRVTTGSRDPKGRPGQRQQKTGLLKKVRMLNTSEYDSGLEPIKKSKK